MALSLTPCHAVAWLLAWALLALPCRAQAPADELAAWEAQVQALKDYGTRAQLLDFLETGVKRQEAAGQARMAAAALLELGKQLRDEDGPRAEQLLERGAALLGQAPDPALQFRYRLLRLGQLKARHQFEQAVAEGNELLATARARRDWRDELKVLLALEEGWEQFHAFSRYIEDAMRLAVAHPGDRLTWWARSEWADRLRSEGRRAEAERLLLEVLQEQVTAGDGIEQIRSLVNLGMFYRSGREWDKLLPLGPRAIRIADQLGRTPTLLPHFLCNQSDALLLAGMPAPALEMADAALVAARGAPGPTHVARFNRGKALNRLGRHGEGLAILEAEAQGPERWEMLNELAEEYAFAHRHEQAYAALQEHLQGLLKSQEESHRAGLSLDQALAEADRERSQRQASERRTQQVITAAVIAAALACAGTAWLLVRAARRHGRELAALNAQLRETAVTDALTGLHNRRHLLSRIEAHVAAADRAHRDQARTGMPPVDLLFFLIDLDHFKRINDSHGHPAGDAVLAEAATRFKGLVRREDELIRWGGEEFLLMTRDTPRDHAAALAERLRQALLQRPFQLPDRQELAVSCSVGFAPYPLGSGGSWQASVELADQALYQAKARGRNGWCGVLRLKPPATEVPSCSLEQAIAQDCVVALHSPSAKPDDEGSDQDS
ncbi:diguanylate cyclase [Roseateles sp.]|uniref:GGDEF domain-containing protein n=1 Tax=Roseateles sp. TaxID=1971397 RepID=UPI002DFE3B5D|nr:diguanylate cyclase [Roseateles sp.]HEV6964099.1 diguanylate cyclase [Roseateles sp.]